MYQPDSRHVKYAALHIFRFSGAFHVHVVMIAGTWNANPALPLSTSKMLPTKQWIPFPWLSGCITCYSVVPTDNMMVYSWSSEWESMVFFYWFHFSLAFTTLQEALGLLSWQEIRHCEFLRLNLASHTRYPTSFLLEWELRYSSCFFIWVVT